MNYLLYGAAVTSDIDLPAAPRTSRAGRISIERGSTLDDRPIQSFHDRHIRGARRRRPWLSIARAEEGYLLRFPDLADFTVSDLGDRITYRTKPRLASSTLGHLLLDHVLPLAISRAGSLALHASAVHVPRFGTIAFVGPAGCGKSTLAAALGLDGCEVVTDDCLVVDIGPRCVAVPGYPGVRLWHDAVRGLGVRHHASARVAHYTVKRRLVSHAVSFRSTPSPIAALFVLGRRRTRGLATRARELGARERLMSLASYVYLMDVEDRRQLAEMFRGLTSLVTRVPVARLNLRDGQRQVRDAATEVLAIARSLSAPAMINRK